MLPWVSVSQTVDADLYACPACSIFQRVDPISVDLGHPDVHDYSVSQRIHMSSNPKTRPNAPVQRPAQAGEARRSGSGRSCG